jgi:hypothetical protein
LPLPFGPTRPTLLPAGFGSAAEPLNFVVDEVFQSFVALGLSMEKFFFLLQEPGVISAHAEDAVGIDAAEFDHFGCYTFEEVAVVTHDYAREFRLSKQFLEPLDASEIEMICGLIQEQNIGRLNQSLGDRQAFLPASGELAGFGIEIFESGPAQGFGEARPPL